jgi:hypothetical protein
MVGFAMSQEFEAPRQPPMADVRQKGPWWYVCRREVSAVKLNFYRIHAIAYSSIVEEEKKETKRWFTNNVSLRQE